ncbi:MAG: shikimate kinase [Saprospiraceae bacterium]|uniref:Shikimate kinase n=1 Tax=Candidatus Defluviibacterium haderslevense TaxID=2981993 RepID=A0A9D7XD85_9BACT|nr:shikimate kinase [Candidatus Defluviibacterium haderslevense]
MPSSYKLLNHVFIIGMPGSGKSSLANKLLSSFGLPIIDIDALIVQEEAQSIAELWKNQGAFYFRLKERMALFNVLASEPKIVATGGGLPCHFNNSFLMSDCYSVFLNVEVNELVLRNTKTKNPLFTSEPMEGQITTLLNRRMVYYERANHVLVAEDNLDVLANNFLNLLLIDGILQSNV